jgi:HAE1 family hydrophobic/amphiphilic exporter-1
LAGPEVDNSLLLIVVTNVRLRRGKPLRQAGIKFWAARMRAILITTVSTSMGLLTMAIEIPNKSIS